MLRQLSLVVCVLILLALGHPAQAMIDISPRIALLMRNSPRFLALDAWNSVTLYSAKDGKPIHKFPSKAAVEAITLTPDEESLLVASGDACLTLWSVETGQQLWHKTPAQTGLGCTYDLSFAHNGKTFIVYWSSVNRNFAFEGVARVEGLRRCLIRLSH
jgi:WD40 repeat protein